MQEILDAIKGAEARQIVSGPPPTAEDAAITEQFLKVKAQEDAAIAKMLKAK